MNPLSILTGYLSWHYTKALVDIVHVWGNFLWFVLHFFSIPTLVLTLASPWRKLHEEYKKGLYIGAFFGTLIVNTLMRLVGIVIRLTFIVIGLVGLGILLVLGTFYITVWLLAPLVVVLGLKTGLMLLLL